MAVESVLYDASLVEHYPGWRTVYYENIAECLKEVSKGVAAVMSVIIFLWLRMCISRMNQENGIPFPMNVNDIPRNRGLEAMKEASRIASEHGISDMTLDEINMEIDAVRKQVTE